MTPRRVLAATHRRVRSLATRLAPAVKGPDVRVSYGTEEIPAAHAPAGGGVIKFQRLAERLPHHSLRFNVLYLGSSSLAPDWREAVARARSRGAAVVVNQNGVAYPAWAGSQTAAINAPLAELLHQSDYVFFQSAFCKKSADTFLGARDARCEILYNAVDTKHFVPPQDAGGSGLRLLLGGDQFQRYRFETAAQTLALVRSERPDAELFVTGRLRFAPDDEAIRDARELLADLGISGHVRFLGPYSQRDAPQILGAAHLLLHTKVNDPCPSVVIEAMACGVPVVYSSSGGVPELVGDAAGIGVASTATWDEDVPPNPADLAHAVLAVAREREAFSHAARTRAVEHFDLAAWAQRHLDVFGELIL
jgi:glycosyltransferase involved in cell wall biosynthesis